MRVDQILGLKGRDVAEIAAAAPLSDAVKLLNTRRIGALVVRDAAGVMVGILSERDILRRLETDPVAVLAAPVRQAMSAPVITITAEAGIDQLMALMTNHRIRHLPVMAGGDVVGIVSIGDVVKAKLDESASEAEALKAYIAS
jgi:CBS domain-containing protein